MSRLRFLRHKERLRDNARFWRIGRNLEGNVDENSKIEALSCSCVGCGERKATRCSRNQSPVG
jgi:hypothetical protein